MIKTIFIVDDNGTNLVAAKQVLQDKYKVMAVLSAKKMFKLLEKIKPDIILLDIDMPEMNGFEAIAELKKSVQFRDIPVIFLTANIDPELESKGFELGAVDYVNKPFSPIVLLRRLEMHLNLDSIIKQRTAEVVRLRNGIVTVAADIVENRDKITGGHIRRTAGYLRILLEAMEKNGVYSEIISKWDFPSVLSSAQLHDIGKIVVSDVILNKPGKFTDEEFELMKTHPTEGAKLIDQIVKEVGSNDIEFLQHAKSFAETHHEKWNGRGYPKGLAEFEIPLEGRVMAISDVYDALMSKRPYKEPFSHEQAVDIIKKDSGTAFDPKLVEVFLDVEQDFLAFHNGVIM